MDKDDKLTHHHYRQSKVSLVSSIIGLVIISQFIVLAVITHVKLDDVNYGYAVNFGTNWQNGPITSFDIEQNSLHCPIGTSYGLSNVVFPGIKAGCYCAPNSYFDVECTTEQQNKGCSSFPDSPSKKVVSWGGALCASRDSRSYFSLNKTDSSNPESKCDKSCGILDTIGSEYCVKENEDCPINYIKILPSGSTPTTDFETKSVPLSNNQKNLYYSNKNIKGTIPAQFIVLDHPPCSDIIENKISLQSDYQCQNEINGFKHDPNWEMLDSMPVSQFVTDNQLDSQMNQYPFYSQIKDKPLNLYYRNYIGLNDTCRDLANSLYTPDSIPGQFLTLQNYVKTSSIDFLSPCSILLFIIIGVCLIVKIYLYFENGSPNQRLYINSVACVSIILLMILSLVSTISISAARNTYIWFSNYSNCSEIIDQQLLYDLDYNLQASYTLGVIFTLLDLILFFLIMIEYLIKHCSDEAPEFDDSQDIEEDADLLIKEDADASINNKKNN